MPASAKSKSTSILLTLGLSLLIAAGAAYVLIKRPAPPTPLEKSDYFPFQDAETGKWGYLDQDAKVAIPAKFDFADLFHGIGLVEDEGLAGYIDDKGQWAIAPRFVLDPARTLGAWATDPGGGAVLVARGEDGPLRKIPIGAVVYGVALACVGGIRFGSGRRPELNV